jgi:short-subunit dehydrogenase
MSEKNPVAIITGASRGFGKAIAELFAAHNYNLIITGRQPVALYNAMELLQSRFPGIEIKAKPADLSKKEEVIALGDWIRHSVPHIDVLINNAGSFVPGSVHNEPDGALEQMMETNLYSAYHLTRTLLPRMIEQGSGHIFNMCSIASLNAYPNGGAYSISKFAMLGFSKNLREEMKPHGIKVTAVLPGAAYTDSWIGSGIDPNRIMEAADVAKLIFAASQLSAQACLEEIVVRPQLGDL